MGINSTDRKASATGKGYQTVQEVAEIATGSICPRLEYLDRRCSAMRKSALSDREDSEGKAVVGKECLLNQYVIGISSNI